MERRTWAWGIGVSLLVLWLVSTAFALRWAYDKTSTRGGYGTKLLEDAWLTVMVRPDVVDPSLPSDAWFEGGFQWNRADAHPLEIWAREATASRVAGDVDPSHFESPRSWHYKAVWTAGGAHGIRCPDPAAARCGIVDELVLLAADTTSAAELFADWIGDPNSGVLPEEQRIWLDDAGWIDARARVAKGDKRRVVVLAQQKALVAVLALEGFEPDRVPLERVMTLLDASLDGIAARVEEEG